MDATASRRLAFIAVAVLGTDAVHAAEHAVLEEVTVTARRRSEALHEVPLAVSQFPAQELEARQIRDVRGLQYSVPNMVVTTDQTNPSTSLIALRGQFEPNSVPTVDQAVGVYLDGVYIARITGANLRLLDVERVEVLRGPQGTLFGRNTIGGAVNIVTQSPSPAYALAAEANVGNYALRDLTGMVNLPFAGGRHALRIAASTRRHDGYGRSRLLDGELGSEDADFARARLRLALAEDWQLDLGADHTGYESSGQQWNLLAPSPSASGVIAASGVIGDNLQNYVEPNTRDVAANRVGAVATRVSGVSAVVTRERGATSLKSITAVRWLDSHAGEIDQDGTPYDLGAVLMRHDEQDQFSQELQWAGRSDAGVIDWMTGLYYFVEHGIFEQDFLAYQPQGSVFAGQLPNGSFRNGSLAAYGQLGYAITPRLRFTAGARFNRDSRQLTSRNARRLSGVVQCQIEPALRDEPGACQATLPRREFTYVPYHLAVDFRPARRAILYAQFGQGYRAGGYNLRGATEAELGTFEPESVETLELGARADLFEDRLRIGLAVFRTDFQNMQLLQRVQADGAPTSVLYVANGGEARIDGLELELTAQLGSVRLAGMLGLIDPGFTHLDAGVVDIDTDSEFLLTPSATAALAVDWALRSGSSAIDLHLDYGWREKVPFAYSPLSIARQEAYGLLNARVEVAIGDTGASLVLWGRNLTDERYLTRAQVAATYVSATPGEPRTWGLGLKYRHDP